MFTKSYILLFTYFLNQHAFLFRGFSLASRWRPCIFSTLNRCGWRSMRAIMGWRRLSWLRSLHLLTRLSLRFNCLTQHLFTNLIVTCKQQSIIVNFSFFFMSNILRFHSCNMIFLIFYSKWINIVLLWFFLGFWFVALSSYLFFYWVICLLFSKSSCFSFFCTVCSHCCNLLHIPRLYSSMIPILWSWWFVLI